ncbi:hypothetical protein DFJ63DRAFT_323881 [Scheffersomyces coipomensis]|uniref:uncharacterized protein n=1 Tax=Scheffersomyces coipomensis TaxID=1788519 RepID=UPI00315DB779
MHHRSFSFDRLKSKVRRSSDSSDLTSTSPPSNQHSISSGSNGGIKKSTDRRNSISNPMIVINESAKESSIPLRNSNIPNSSSSRLRAQSLSFINSTNSRSRSRSTSRSNGSSSATVTNTSNTTNNNLVNSTSNHLLLHHHHHHQSSSLSNALSQSSKRQTKELIKQETSQIISKKLLHILQDLGLQHPIPLKTTNSSPNGSVSKSVRVYVANSNDCIYLPPASSASFTYEDVENGGGIIRRNENEDITNDEDDNTNHNDQDIFNNETCSFSLDDEQQQHVPKNLQQKLKSFQSPNYLCTKIDSDLPIPHTFAIIIELSKDSTTIKDLKFEFQSLTNILWPSGDPYNKINTREKFKIGALEWSTNLKNSDYYINTSNSNDIKIRNLTADDLAKRTKEYKLVNIRDLTDGVDSINNSKIDDFSSSSGTTSSSSNSSDDTFKAGLYVFLLPILLPDHIPSTIISVNGSLQHSLSINFNKTTDKLNRKIKMFSNYNLPMVRTPPSFANSIADKPIYVNRIWNDALHYVITFPKKYISLGSEHVINVKLVPLVKDVIIKRIKFNVLERITYVSKNLSREFDYDSEDPYCTRPDNGKIRERVVSLCELKTKVKQSSNSNNNPLTDPYKEEIIKCPDNNLLFSCYEPESGIQNNDVDPLSKKSRKKSTQPPHPNNNETMIASPLDINIALPFLTTKGDKILKTSTYDDEFSYVSSAPGSRKASISVDTSATAISPSGSPSFLPSVGTLETNMSHVDLNDTHYNTLPQPHPFHLHPSHLLHQSSTSPLSSSPPTSENIHIPDHIVDESSSLNLPITRNGFNLPPENISQGYTVVTKALYPDSNFRHVQIHHRLQVCFRISKPDPKDDFKMHHYEVVVDTPLILLSSKCNDQSIQLPRYNEIDVLDGSSSSISSSTKEISFRTPNYSKNGVSIKPLDNGLDYQEQLPSFEEATTSPAKSSAPITRSISFGLNDPLSRVPSISPATSPMRYPNEPAPAYEEECAVFDEDDEGTNLGEEFEDDNDDDDLSPARRKSSVPELNIKSADPIGIDELVSFNDPNIQQNASVSSVTTSSSRLRSSLVSSFAPVPKMNRKNSSISSTQPKNSVSNATNNSDGSINNTNDDNGSVGDDSISSKSSHSTHSSNHAHQNGIAVTTVSSSSLIEPTNKSIVVNEKDELSNTVRENHDDESPLQLNELVATSQPMNQELSLSSSSNDEEVDSIVYLNNSNAGLILQSESTGLTSVEDSEVVNYDDEDDYDDDDKGSLFTQETNASQRVPLITRNSNRTVETISKNKETFGHILTPSMTNTSMLTTTTTTNHKLSTISNDNLSILDGSISASTNSRVVPQDIYHAIS